MALFQKKPHASDSMPLYTLGLHQTVLVVGLGNPEKKYDGTRHNIGFACVDEFVSKQSFDPWVEKKDLKCLFSSGTIGATRVIVIKPTTYMNLSGEAVQATTHFYKLTLANLVVVHDELDVAFGQIRTRRGGSDAGHNGIKSIMQHVGADFNRIRVGIGIPDIKGDSADFVLAKFGTSEMSQMSQLTREVNSLLTEFVASGELSHDTRSFII